MTREEYRISLAAWNRYLSDASGFEINRLMRAFGSLGKALSEFQSIYSVFARKGSHPYSPQFNEYVDIVEELRFRTEVRIIAIEEDW